MSAMNDFHDAMHTLWDTVAEHNPSDDIRPLKRIVWKLFEADSNLSGTDANHPYTRFARTGTFHTCHVNFQIAVTEAVSGLGFETLRDQLFDVPDTPCYDRAKEVLVAWRSYVRTLFPEDSDSDSDSDSD